MDIAQAALKTIASIRCALVGLLLGGAVLGAAQAAPQRIVSLLPSLTETVCALGACQRLVGVDRYSNFPASVRSLPKVGGGLDPSVEAIVALRPDLVLVAGSAPVVQRLQSLGLTVLVLEPKTHADMRRVLQQLGDLLGVGDPLALWRSMDLEVKALGEALPLQARGARVYFEVNSAPYAAGEASFMGETLARMGLRNIVPSSMGPFPRINPEFVVRADPDVILVGDVAQANLAQRPGWAGMRAMRAQRVCVFTQDESDTLVRPGPRMAEGARTVAQCLRRVWAHQEPAP